MIVKQSLGERIACALGAHNWYHGFFVVPVWGRYERHCLDCGKQQYKEFDKNKNRTRWITFVKEDYLHKLYARGLRQIARRERERWRWYCTFEVYSRSLSEKDTEPEAVANHISRMRTQDVQQ